MLGKAKAGVKRQIGLRLVGYNKVLQLKCTKDFLKTEKEIRKTFKMFHNQ